MPTTEHPTFPVNLYVYDLSRGMARTMSLALLGKIYFSIFCLPRFHIVLFLRYLLKVLNYFIFKFFAVNF